MIIGTAGHIDHGKTALVRALTGIETDRLKEEKARGITIENGYAYQALVADQPDGARIGFVDMPGHERFIPTMLAGATGISFALLVIAADDGVMPQTREHVQILQLLRMQRGAVALTKIDLVDAARREQVEREIAALLAATFLAEAPLIAVSSISGTGIAELKNLLHAAATSWHHAQRAHGDTATNGEQFRLAVDRSFTIDGRGTVVTGTVHAGTLQVGETVRVLSSSATAQHTSTARVRSLHALDRSAMQCRRGQRVALNLVGIESSAVQRGDWIVAPVVTQRSDRVAVRLSLSPGAATLQHWTPVHLHVGATHTTAHVVLLDCARLSAGCTALAELALATPLHLCHGDLIVLRDASAQTTIGAAVILDIEVPARGKRSDKRLALLAAQDDTDVAQALQRTLALAPQGIDLGGFAANRNLPIDALPTLLATQDAVQIPSARGLVGCTVAHWQTMQQKILLVLAIIHAREPDYAGVERARLRRISLPTVAVALFDALIDALCATAQIVVTQHVFLALPTHRLTLTESEAMLWQKILPHLLSAPFQPPRVRPLAQTFGMEEGALRQLMNKCARLGQVLRIAHDHYFAPVAVQTMAQHVLTLAEQDGAATVAAFRDRIGTGRKLAVEILEFFDRVGFTRRIHDRHSVRQASMWQDAESVL